MKCSALGQPSLGPRSWDCLISQQGRPCREPGPASRRGPGAPASGSPLPQQRADLLSISRLFSCVRCRKPCFIIALRSRTLPAETPVKGSVPNLLVCSLGACGDAGVTDLQNSALLTGSAPEFAGSSSPRAVQVGGCAEPGPQGSREARGRAGEWFVLTDFMRWKCRHADITILLILGRETRVMCRSGNTSSRESCPTHQPGLVCSAPVVTVPPPRGVHEGWGADRPQRTAWFGW